MVHEIERRAGRREADRRIRVVLGMQDADCPDVWRRAKTMPADAMIGLLDVAWSDRERHESPPEG